MHSRKTVRTGVNGCGMIGERVADAIVLQDDMTLVGVCDVVTDWRMRVVMRKGWPLFSATRDYVQAMSDAELDVAGTLDDLHRQVDLVA
jgi:glyceraldehyde-3-phosphate dehydrogenase (NAD(P)+) (phosphorylating)